MIHALFIPRWHPTPLNKLLGNHYQTHRLKKADREMIWAYAKQAKIPPATGMRRVTLTIILAPGRRAADPDAYFKSGVDALVHAGMLVDDNRQHVALMPVQFDRSSAWGTRITVEDLA